MPKKTSQIFLVDHPEDGPVIDSRHPNTKEEQNEIAYITKHLDRMYDNCQAAKFHEYGDRTIKQYCDDNEKRINSYVPPRGNDVDDWQTNGFEGITREKMLAFVAKVAMDIPQYKFKAVRDDDFMDITISDIMGTVFRHSWWEEDPIGIKFLEFAWATAGCGVGITYEGIEQDEYEEYEFDDFDVRTGELTNLSSKVKRSPVKCRQRIVHPTRFLWDNMYGGRDVQKQVRIAEIETYSYDEFQNIYGGYYKAEYVPRSWAKAITLFDKSFHQKQWKSFTEDDEVCVVKFWTKERGKSLLRIIANGVLILATPNPRKDGMYPYSTTVFRPFADSSFVGGKALPDEIASDQDIYNGFKNMALDRQILYLNRPMYSDKPNELLDEVWGPNRILNIKGDKVQSLDIQPISAADIQVMQELRGSMNRQTSDPAQSGQAGSGVTAREIVIADENARKLMGVARKYLEYGHWQGSRLRLGDIMQYYFDPLEVEDTLSQEQQDALKKVYRKVTLDGETLGDGKTGTRSIDIVPTRDDLKPQEYLDVQEEMARMQGRELEQLQVTASYLRRFQRVDVLLIPESSFQQSKSIEQALELEYQKILFSLYPDKFQMYKDALFRNFNKVYGRDTSEFDRISRQQPPPQPAAVGPDGQPAAPGGQPVPGASPAAQAMQPNNPAALSTMLGAM